MYLEEVWADKAVILALVSQELVFVRSCTERGAISRKQSSALLPFIVIPEPQGS